MQNEVKMGVSIGYHYILVIKDDKDDKNERSQKIISGTLENAEIVSRELVKIRQNELVEEFPFAPPMAEGILYRAVHKIDGAEFITPNPKPMINDHKET